MGLCIALLRGINVGRSKRLAMADLRKLIEGLGCSNVRTLLNSGNAVFECDRSSPKKLATQIESAIMDFAGFDAPVTVLTAAEFERIVASDTLLPMAADPSRHLVAFVPDRTVLRVLAPMTKTDWSPENFHLGPEAAYLWCPDGIIESKMLKALAKLTKNESTTRNWATVERIHALVTEMRAV